MFAQGQQHKPLVPWIGALLAPRTRLGIEPSPVTANHQNPGSADRTPVFPRPQQRESRPVNVSQPCHFLSAIRVQDLCPIRQPRNRREGLRWVHRRSRSLSAAHERTGVRIHVQLSGPTLRRAGVLCSFDEGGSTTTCCRPLCWRLCRPFQHSCRCSISADRGFMAVRVLGRALPRSRSLSLAETRQLRLATNLNGLAWP